MTSPHPSDDMPPGDQPGDSSDAQAGAQADASQPPDDSLFGDEPIATEELERLYQQAVDAIDVVSWQVEQEIAEADELVEHGSEAAPDEGPGGAESSDDAPAAASDEEVLDPDLPTDRRRARPERILEAALFVGGSDLTIKRLCGLFRGEFTQDNVTDMIDELNRAYRDEGRPYEVRFGEGGYRMALRADYDRVRDRVFGHGPKEIKLSQEVLEVLAIVAYRQPISRDEVVELSNERAAGVLRQLLRRELIAIQREGDRDNVRYHTTGRFLDVFGLRDLDELPQAEDFVFK